MPPRQELARPSATWLELLLLIAVTFPLAGCEPRLDRGESTAVRVSMNLPITGPFGIYGQTIRDGALLAVADIDQADGEPPLLLDTQDNGGVPATAVTVFQQQMVQSPDIYVSGVKPQTMAVFDQVIAEDLPYFVWIFDAFVTTESPNVFRTWVSYKYEPELYLEYVDRIAATRVSIACVNVPHTLEEFQDIVIPALSQRGVEVDLEIYDASTTDYFNLVQRLSATTPDLYILNGFQENIVGLIRALRTYDLIGPDNVIGTYDVLDAALELTPQELEGIHLVTPAFELISSPALNSWKSRFEDRFRRRPLYTDAYSYDMISLIADAARRLGDDRAPDAWRRALLATDTPGVTGRLRFDADGDLLLDLRLAVFRNGVLVPLEPI